MSREAFLEIWVEIQNSLRLSAQKFAKGDADDVVQDVFIAAWLCCGKFTSDKYCRKWLYISVRNKAIDYLRKGRYTSLLSLDIPTQKKTELPEDDEIKLLHKAIERLPRRQRQITSRALAGESTEAIGKALGVDTATIRSLWRYARLRIAQHLTELEGDK